VGIAEGGLAMLNECAERLGTTRANVIVMGVEKVHRELIRE